MSYTLEITGKAIRQIVESRELIPPGTPVNIAFLGNETHEQRFEAARLIRDCGFEPVPIISSRRLLSEADAAAVIEGYLKAANPQRFIFVGGDPETPAGPYRDSNALLQSGVLARFAIQKLGIVAYPEGHPAIPTAKLWEALRWKAGFLQDQGVEFEITTQFVLDPDCLPVWLADLRKEGIACPVCLGLPAPAPARRLLAYARQFGTKMDRAILENYQMPPETSADLADPRPFLERLALGLRGIAPGKIGTHLYPFGGIGVAAEWAKTHAQLLPDCL